MTCIDCCYALLKDGIIHCTYEDGNCIITDRIKRLEAENAELKTKCKHNCPNCVAFGKHCPHKVNGDPYFYDCYLTVVELEKENAELKEYTKYLKRERQGGIQKQYNKVAIIKQQAEKLTRAKKIIESLLPFEHVIDPYALTSDFEENQKRFHEPFRRAEQFLKEV